MSESKLEADFLWQLKAEGLPRPDKTEFSFAKNIGRKWRADFAWSSIKLIVEIEGGEFINGRHNRNLAKDASKYKKRIEEAVPNEDNFHPLMTLYLTENTNKYEISKSYQEGLVFAAKLYPAGATTNSESDSDVDLKNRIRKLLESGTGVPINIDKLETIKKQLGILRQKMSNLIKRLEDIKQSKGINIIDVNKQIQELQNEVTEIGNTINLDPQNNLIRGGSTPTSITENKIKNIGDNIEKIKSLMSNNINQDKKEINIDTLNKNYNLFISQLQNFSNDILEYKDQSSTINVKKTNQKIDELSKSFEELRAAFE